MFQLKSIPWIGITVALTFSLYGLIRKKINGTASVPRIAVFKSNNNIYVQAIDDLNQVTIASASTLSKEVNLEPHAWHSLLLLIAEPSSVGLESFT